MVYGDIDLVMFSRSPVLIQPMDSPLSGIQNEESKHLPNPWRDTCWHRFSAVMRASGEFTTERELQDVIRSLKDTLGTVTEFTVIVDDRAVSRAYGFLVELEGNPSSLYGPFCFEKFSPGWWPGPRASTSPSLIHEMLLKTNETYAQFSSRGMIRVPTIRLLAPNTFRSYREWKSRKSPAGSGQVKVPTVVYDIETRDWLLERVVTEIWCSLSSNTTTLCKPY